MKYFSMFMLLLAVIVCRPVICDAADEDEEAPPAPRNPAELMKAVHMKPITAPPGSRTWEEVHVGYVAWVKRVLLDPMRTKTASHPQGAAAVKLAEEILTFLYKPRQKDPGLAAEFLKRGQAIAAQGLTDPVLLWLTARAALLSAPETSTRKELLEQAHAKIAGSGYSALLTILICEDLCGTRALDKDKNPLFVQAAKACIAVKEEPGTFQGDEARWYIETTFDIFANSFENSHADLFKKVYDAPSFPEWARETLAGKFEINLAWKDRGGGWSNTVPEKGWVGFAEHLEKARTHLLKAWTLNPKEPYAATRMLSVVGGGNGGPGDTLRLWFDRATAAIFDELGAYNLYLHFTRPRWGGSYEEMAAFGLACAETKRFDTSVPKMLLDALDDIAKDAESPEARKRLFSDPTIAPAVTFVCESYIKAAPTPAGREFWLARLALYGWLAGDYTKAGAAIKQLQGRMDPAVARTMRSMHLDSATLLADCAVSAAGEMKNLESAVALYEKRSYAEARTAFTALGKKAGADALPVMRRWLELMDIEERFQRGEVITLTADTDLSLWSNAFGIWKGGPDGSLVSTGWDGQGRIFHRARFGDRVEFQADVVFSDPKPHGQGLGLALGGRRFGTDNFTWNTCCLTTTENKETVMAGIFYTYTKASPALQRSPLKDLSRVHLLARSEDKTLSFKINDWVAYTKQSATRTNKAKDPFQYSRNGQVGFSYPNFMTNHTITIKNMTVRRVP